MNINGQGEKKVSNKKRAGPLSKPGQRVYSAEQAKAERETEKNLFGVKTTNCKAKREKYLISFDLL